MAPDVETLGTDFYVGNFESTDDGRRAGESLMDEGADIIMPVAGPVGLGTAEAVKERGGMLIGVDTDWSHQRRRVQGHHAHLRAQEHGRGRL